MARVRRFVNFVILLVAVGVLCYLVGVTLLTPTILTGPMVVTIVFGLSVISWSSDYRQRGVYLWLALTIWQVYGIITGAFWAISNFLTLPVIPIVHHSPSINFDFTIVSGGQVVLGMIIWLLALLLTQKDRPVGSA